MSGYTKLFGSILHSTIWLEKDHVRLVWITMLAMCDKRGLVETSIPGLASAARVSLENVVDALNRLQSPDPYSRTGDDEGRRIRTVDGGFALINHGKYREKLSADERREYQRTWKANKRRAHREAAAAKAVDTKSTSVEDNRPSRHIPDPDADTDTKITSPLTPQGAPGDLLSGPQTLGQVQKVVNIWNEERKPGPKVRRLDGKRRGLILKALRDVPNLEDWRKLIRWMNVQDWMNGKGDRRWTADIDFLLRPGNVTKYLDRAEDVGPDQSGPRGVDPSKGRTGFRKGYSEAAEAMTRDTYGKDPH